MARPAIRIGIALVFGVAVAGCGSPDPVRSDGAPPNVLIVLLDACRADKFSTFGFERPTTPHLDALAADPDAVAFDRHHTQGSWTKPTTASLFTGHLPSDHLVEMHSGFSSDFHSLAEYFDEHGFYTFAIASNYHLKPEYGFGQGFDDYVFGPELIAAEIGWLDELLVTESAEKAKWWLRHFAEDWTWMRPFVGEWTLPRDETQAKALRKMIAAAQTPFFGYAHFQGCHYPFVTDDRDPEYLDEYGIEYDEEARVADGVDFSDTQIAFQINRKEVILEPDDVEFLHRLYEAKTHLADRIVLGNIVEFLREQGLYDDTLIVVTSDHGEALDDRGVFSHQTVYQEILNIPLVVKFPKGGKPGSLATRVTGITRTIDLLPSLTNYYGFDSRADVPGMDVFGGRTADYALAQGYLVHPEDEDEARPASEPGAHFWRERAVRSDRFKLRQIDGEAALFDLEADSGEFVDASAENPEILAELQSMLEPLHASEERAQSADAAPIEEIDEETVRWLRAMGYVE